MSVAVEVVHPAAELLPAPTAAEYAALRDDIAAHGLRLPIVVDLKGRLLDGRNRLRACRELGITPTTSTFDGDPIAYVLSTNVHRRNLTQSQRAAVAAEAEAMYADAAKERQRAAGPTSVAKRTGETVPATWPEPSGRGEAIEHAARSVGAGTRSARRAKRVKDADPDLHEKVKNGEMTVTAAEDQVKANRPPPPPRALVAAIKERERLARELAAAGHTYAQIADRLGLGIPGTKKLCQRIGVTAADAVLGPRRAIDPNRVVDTVVTGVADLVGNLDLANPKDLDGTRLEEWVTSLRSSIRSLNRLVKEMS